MESKFQFTNPALISMNYIVNSDFSIKNHSQINIKQKISVDVESYDGRNETSVALQFELGEKDSIECPFYLVAKEKASFRWDDELSSEQVRRLLNQNAPSLLLSYLRPIISQVTAMSPSGAFNIPFINFTNN